MSDTLSSRAESAQSTTTTVRTDIQALRALAVSLVFLFHLWPNRMTGGFVGVDVFFVISGFLITSHLLAHPPTKAGDLLGFWARRIQRLLPASLLVLALTVVGSRMFAPETEWGSTAAEIKAATLYYVNWNLASSSVDYLGAEAAPSPVQHYWSLSIEEQFYLGWPVLLLLLFLLARVLKRPATRVVVPGLALAVAASLVYSITETASNPAGAYFVTPTRIWELGLGGLLAGLLSRRAFGRDVDHEHVLIPEAARSAVAWIGFGAITLTAFTYTGGTPFPGWQALLPVLGTVAVIAVDAPLKRHSPGPILAWKPIQFLGDISYSVYLWHWPMVVLVPQATGHQLTLQNKLAILVATLVLATLTKFFIEDVFRRARFRTPLWKPYVAMVLAMGLVWGMAHTLDRYFDKQQDLARQELIAAKDSDDPCFGAKTLANREEDCPRTKEGPVVPAPNLAIDDKSDAYRDGCWEWVPFDGVKTCEYGDESSDVHIALVGNSHAGHWLPALQVVAENQGWHITTILASECTATRTKVDFKTDEDSQGCLDWGQRVLDLTAEGDFDVVVTSERNGRKPVDAVDGNEQELWEQGYQDYLADWIDQGQRVVVIHDTPTPGVDDVRGPECIAENEDGLGACTGLRDDWVPNDALVNAAEKLDDPLVSVIDLTDYICGPKFCDVAVGGVGVYFDASHITATYAETLGPFLGQDLVPMVQKAVAKR
ncbi:acyltransferase family protein [Nocardioides jensenii]|uniref:acyltransferase family protein n=1 Tax=Nocardioides jensenii TaxID=1843 RepID=UPI00083313F6|nr:acyltransferase family protein [Nocardioides jensenii]